MIQDFSKAARFLLTLLLLICFVSVARAQTPANLTGVYNGKYTCGQGATNLKLSLVASADGDVTALFTFYLPPGTQQQGYTYSLHGDYNLKTSKVSLSPVRWETQQPAGFNMVGMNGTFDGGELSGAIYGAGCSTFNVQRDEAESTNIAAVIAAQTDPSKLKAAEAPAPAAPPAPAPAKDPYMAALQAQAPSGVKIPATAAPATRPSAYPAAPPAQRAAPKATAQAASPKAPAAPPASPALAKTAAPSGTIKYLCYTTDAALPALYFSDIFDLPDEGSQAGNFIDYELSRTNFELYLNGKYGYAPSNPSDDHFAECGYVAVGNQAPEAVAQTIAAKKQTLIGQATAAKKQVVSTGWKYTEKDKQATVAKASSGKKAPAGTVPAAPAKAVPPAAPAASTKAASAAQPGGTLKYLCYTTDPKQSVVYFTDIFDVPDTGSDAENFISYRQAKIGFELYMNEKYTYVSSDPNDIHFADCAFRPVGNQKPETVIQALTGKKQSLTAQAAAAKKQVVSTGWKYTGKDDDPATDSSAPVVWKMDSTKDELTGAMSSPQPKSFKVYMDNRLAVSISASCASNGVGVFFLATAFDDKDAVPNYAWYIDQSDDSGEQIADVRIVVDGGSVHMAQGWPNKDGHTLYTNNLGLLFYEPNIVAHSEQQQEDNANTGILALDGLLAPYVRQAAKSNAQSWADSSAGPMTALLNAKSVRVELPITNKGIKPIVDLNPQDKVLHQFVSDCYAKFTSGSRQTSPARAPAATGQRMTR